jgi:tetratricopeptide (TPR) repeat protein
MEVRRQLDPACPTPAGEPLIRALTILVLLGCTLSPAAAQSFAQDSENISHIKQLVHQERWQEIVRVAEGVPAPSGDLLYYYGSALAQLGRWQDARRAFLRGYHLQSGSKRFPLELAGVAFRQKDYAEAARWLRRALQIAPRDSYAEDFLATIYFLQDNTEAALKHWNRIGKPKIASLRLDPLPRVDAALLDSAFAFSPASTLQLRDLLTTDARLRGLEIFPTYALDLNARDDGQFDVVFRNRERNGWEDDKWQALASFFRGIFQQTVYPEYFNLRHSALNLMGMARWDAEKRRYRGAVSGPWGGSARRRFRLGADVRNENWDIRRSFTGPAPLLGGLNLRRESVTAGITSFESGRWSWSTGAELSHRDFRSVIAGTALTPSLLSQGYELKHLAEVGYELWRLPERRFVVRAGASSQAGRIWSQPSHSFLKLQSSVRARWFPQARGDDYETEARLQAGKTFGQVPFDELFRLGLDPDNELLLRAHIGTRDGRPGSSPLGGNYFLSNWELDKNVYQAGLFGLKLGPFLDTGKITDPSPGLGAQKWQWDIGAQAKVRVLGVGLVFSYGKDLRSGANAFYARVGR